MTDSDPYTSDSDSSDTSDDSEAEIDVNEDIEFIARELLNRSLPHDGDGDAEDGENAGANGMTEPPRTRNEIAETGHPRPNIEITSDMDLKLLGPVHSIVDDTITIAAVDGTRILDSSTPLRLEDRTVVGALADTSGTSKNLFHTVVFGAAQDITNLKLSRGVNIYYPVQFAQIASIDASKGYDTSNIYDEEVEDGSDFSDDEKEQAHKRATKDNRANRRAGRDNRGGDIRGGRNPHGKPGSKHTPCADVFICASVCA